MAADPIHSLPYSKSKQDAILGHFLFNPAFFLQGRHFLTPRWFVDDLCVALSEAALEFFDQVKRPPTEAELRDCNALRLMEEGQRARAGKKITACQKEMLEYGLDALREETTTWLKTTIYRKGLEETDRHFNLRQYGQAFSSLKATARSIEEASLEEQNQVTFHDVAGFFQQREVDFKDACTFGFELIDKKLNAEATEGALLLGDHTVLLAPTNIGKTTVLINVAILNVLKGKSVLMITHEGRQADIQLKLLKCLLKKTGNEIMDGLSDPKTRSSIEYGGRFLTERLTYLSMNKPALTVEEVEGTIRRHQEKRIAETGKGYDLIINDYPAKLTTPQASKGHWQPRQVGAYTYGFFTQIGLDLNAHVLTSIQTNREGSKVNKQRKGAEARLLVMEDVSEVWEAMTTATNVMSVNRDPIAEARNRMTLYIDKSRSNETGWAIVTKTDFSRALTHGRGFDATCYRGMSTMEGKIDSLLEDYKGVAIPETHYFS